jgi:zinc/manganese transport system substrate-binding protein
VSSIFSPGVTRPRRVALAAGAAAVLAVALAGCSTASDKPASGSPGGSAVINVVAAENFWGSLAEQLGGSHVKVTNIINNPDADPHDYEPTAADGRAIATAQLAIINGVGYDAWATKLAEANPSSSRTTLTVADLAGVTAGTTRTTCAPSSMRSRPRTRRPTRLTPPSSTPSTTRSSTPT